MSNITDMFAGGPTTGQRLRLLHVRDEKPSATVSGTFTAGAWQTRTLNTVKTNEISGASVATNQVTLPAGSYYIEAYGEAYQPNAHKIKLRNITDSEDTIIGSSAWNWASDNTNTTSVLSGKIDLSSPKVFELQHKCSNTSVSHGFGSTTSLGVDEVYAEVKIWQILDSRALPVQAELFHTQQQETSGTGGGTFTFGAWRTRTINTVVSNAIDGASLSGNQIILPAGKYLIEAYAVAHAVNRHQAKLYNITDSSDIFMGTSLYSWASDATGNKSSINGEFSLASTKTLEIQHQSGATAVGNGFGQSAAFGTEIYVDVRICKIG